MSVEWSRFGNKHLIELMARDGTSDDDGNVISVDELIDMGFAILQERQQAADRRAPRRDPTIQALRDRYGMTQTSINTLIVVSCGQKQRIERQIERLTAGGDVTVNLDNAALFTVSNRGNRDTWDVGTRGSVTFTVEVSGSRKKVVHLSNTSITERLHAAGDPTRPLSATALRQLHPVAFRPTVAELGAARARLRHVTTRPAPTRQNFLGKYFPVAFFDPTPPVFDRPPSIYSAPPGVSPAAQLAAAQRRMFDDEEDDED